MSAAMSGNADSEAVAMCAAALVKQHGVDQETALRFARARKGEVPVHTHSVYSHTVHSLSLSALLTVRALWRHR